MFLQISTCLIPVIVFLVYKAYIKLKNIQFFANAISKATPDNLTNIGFGAIWSINDGKKCKHPSHHIDMETFKPRCSHCGELDT